MSTANLPNQTNQWKTINTYKIEKKLHCTCNTEKNRIEIQTEMIYTNDYIRGRMKAVIYTLTGREFEFPMAVLRLHSTATLTTIGVGNAVG